eukprot:GABU01007967.1.p3 GENE.GABU01007967.1~~GABU01007967.1.p3  ORF type:complete len:104 (+),score=1.75 GABU01007967.1:107-418(+)
MEISKLTAYPVPGVISATFTTEPSFEQTATIHRVCLKLPKVSIYFRLTDTETGLDDAVELSAGVPVILLPVFAKVSGVLTLPSDFRTTAVVVGGSCRLATQFA